MSNFLDSLTGGLGTGIASVGTGLISSMIGNSNAKKAEARQFEYQKQLMQMQNDYQVSNWNAQFDKINEYNDPRNQMRRLTNAGINPNNSAAGMNGNASGATPSMSAPTGQNLSANYESPDLSSAVSNGIAGYTLGLQSKSTAADVAQKNEQTRGMRLENDLLQDTLDERRQTPKLENEQIKKNIEKTVKEIKNVDLQNACQEWTNNVLNPLIEKGKVEEINQMKQSIEESKARVTEIDAKIKEVHENIKKIKADTAKSWSEKSLVDKQVESQELDNEIKRAIKDEEIRLKELEREKQELEMKTFEELGFVPTGSQYVDLMKFFSGNSSNEVDMSSYPGYDSNHSQDLFDILLRLLVGFDTYDMGVIWNYNIRDWKQRHKEDVDKFHRWREGLQNGSGSTKNP